MIGYKFYDVTITGIADLLMHNGSLADPTSVGAKEMKQVTSKRKKVDADYERLSDLEFRYGLYLDEAGRITIPPMVIESMIVSGAKKSKSGKEALSAMFVEQAADFRYAGPLSPEDRMADPTCRLVIGVRNPGQSGRVMRTRPRFSDWSLSFTVSVMADQINGEHLETWIRTAGTLVGLCDYRPRFGRFVVSSFVEQQLAKAA